MNLTSTSVKAKGLRGGIKGLFANKCTTIDMTGSGDLVGDASLSMCAITGHVGGDAFVLVYKVASGGVKGFMNIYG